MTPNLSTASQYSYKKRRADELVDARVKQLCKTLANNEKSKEKEKKGVDTLVLALQLQKLGNELVNMEEKASLDPELQSKFVRLHDFLCTHKGFTEDHFGNKAVKIFIESIRNFPKSMLDNRSLPRNINNHLKNFVASHKGRFLREERGEWIQMQDNEIEEYLQRLTLAYLAIN